MNYSMTTKLDGREVMQKATSFFGAAGIGLGVSARSDCCVRFEGGGGHVQVAVSLREGRTELNLETREWDYQVKQFMHALA